jgi:hypothetical protein
MQPSARGRQGWPACASFTDKIIKQLVQRALARAKARLIARIL